jgi:hypothetical protein
MSRDKKGVLGFKNLWKKKKKKGKGHKPKKNAPSLSRALATKKHMLNKSIIMSMDLL